MTFPPIFALVIFGILDFIELVFDITGFGAPVGVFLSFLSTLLYFIQVFMRYGWKKMVEKLFKYKGIPKKKAAKKVMKVFGNTIIPFVTVWAVWDDYQEEKKDITSKSIGKNNQKTEGGVTKELYENQTTESSSTGYIKQNFLATQKGIQSIKQNFKDFDQAISNGDMDLANSVLNSTNTILSVMNKSKNTADKYFKDISQPYAETREQMETIYKNIEEASSSMSRMKSLFESNKNKDNSSNPWIKTKTKVGGKEEKTIAEEVSGIKTGLSSQEDYTEGLPDFSRPETYDNLLREREENKKKDEQKRKEIEETRLIQKQREKVEAEKVFDRAFIRRFGTQAYERMVRDRELRKGKGRKIPGKDSDKYRESA